MKLADASIPQIEELLRSDGLTLDFGYVKARVRSRVRPLASVLQIVYGAFPLEAATGFCDLTVTLLPQPGLRRWLRPQIQFYLEGETPFEAFDAATHLPMLEWGMNWGIAQRFTDMLLLHAGVVERDGRAIVLPAMPGSGKSTLTAGLTQRGYRLLSDEFGAVEGDSGQLRPVLRPIALKNESIEVIRRFSADAVLGPAFPKTRKGTVAHMAPDAYSVALRRTAAQARLIVFPQYVAGARTQLEAVPKSRALARLSVNAFNYELRGPAGYKAVAQLIDQCDCYTLHYGDMEDAIATLGHLLQQDERHAA